MEPNIAEDITHKKGALLQNLYKFPKLFQGLALFGKCGMLQFNF